MSQEINLATSTSNKKVTEPEVNIVDQTTDDHDTVAEKSDKGNVSV